MKKRNKQKLKDWKQKADFKHRQIENHKMSRLEVKKWEMSFLRQIEQDKKDVPAFMKHVNSRPKVFEVSTNSLDLDDFIEKYGALRNEFHTRTPSNNPKPKEKVRIEK